MQIAILARERPWLHAIALGCASLVACGGSDHADTVDASAESCGQVGQNETGCRCSSEQPSGHRDCRQDFTWSQCTCPPPSTPDCTKVGEAVQCAPCPGETKGHTTKCLQGGTFDCACDR